MNKNTSCFKFLLICGVFLCALSMALPLGAANMTPRKDIAAENSDTTKVVSPDEKAAQPEKKTASSIEEQLAQDPKYQLASNLLDATISLLETRITPEQHKRLTRWQKKWKDGEQAAEIRRLSATMPKLSAYTKAIEDRMDILLRIAAVVPMSAHYEGEGANFSTSVHDGVVTVQGAAFDKKGHSCTFEGMGALEKGWIQVSNRTTDDFYVLFTPKAAYISYLGTPKDMGCLDGVNFIGAYVKQIIKP